MGEMLANELRRRLPVEVVVHIFYSNRPRSEGDYNRPVTRDSPWRQEIQRHVEGIIASDKQVLLYDVHSFPNVCEDFCRHSDNRIPQLVLLDSEEDPHANLLELAKEEAALTVASLLHAAHKNDITEQARKAGAEAMLWEFNESKLRLTEEQALKVIRVLASYAKAKYETNKRS